MSTKTRDGLNFIVEAINNIVEPKVATLRYDKTYRAKVTEVISDNLYKVQINGAEYELSYSGNLDVGEIVKVKAPLNNFSDIYIEAVPGSGGGRGGGGSTNYNDLTNKPVLNSNNSTALTPNSNETIRGTISLHKVSKTGNYNDLLNRPSLNFIPTSQKGAPSGVASLDSNTKIPVAQLPIATTSSVGAIRVGTNLSINGSGVLSATDTTDYDEFTNKPILNTNNTSELTVNANETIEGTINLHAIAKTGNYTDLINKPSLNFIPTSQKGTANGVASLGANSKIPSSQIPIASSTILGGIKVGDNLSIESDGTLNATGGGSVDLLSSVYPLGSIYMSMNNVSPETFIGGHWKYIAQGRTLIGVDTTQSEFNSAGNTGGEKNHVLTTSEMPSHTHTFSGNSHTHTLNNHTHTYNKSNSITGSHVLTVNEIPAHKHNTRNIKGAPSGSGVWSLSTAGYTSNEWNADNVSSTGGGQGHTHTISTTSTTTGGSNSNTSQTTVSGNNSSTGGGTAHNNLPPYITCYMWVRYLTSDDAEALVLSQKYNNDPNYVVSTEQTNDFYYVIRAMNNTTTQNYYWNVYMYSGEIVKA